VIINETSLSIIQDPVYAKLPTKDYVLKH